MRSGVLSIVLALLLSGCVTPQTETPAGAPIRSEVLGLTGTAENVPAEEWWQAFADAQLDTLMADALRDSPSLAQALARVRSARAQATAANAANDPHFALDAEETWQRLSADYYVPPPFGGNRYWVGQATANLSWTLDFWGRQAALIRQAESQFAASRLDVEAARLALTGAIAQAYLNLHRTWDLLDIATRLQVQREELLRLTRGRVDAGLDTQIELKTAEANLAQARAGVMQAESARDLAVHRLAALAGYGADRYAQIQRPQLNVTAELSLPDRLPLDLLSHRPDVLATRARIEAATAGRAAARAAFYPDVNLKAFVGTQAIGLDNLAKHDSLVYGAGPALHLPIFDAQRLRAEYQGATAELDAAVATYNATVLDAVRETADQLTLSATIVRQIGAIQQAVDASTGAYDLARKRYGAGLTTQLTVLNADAQVLDARRDLVNANADLVSARVALRMTLGGRFDAATHAPAASGVSR
ncbi:MAG TPA: efflux transporter outer membrane subunit [Steroidobacteraceae bacterium]|nr:efflux transporter outer membrane subunit [Steroidobacteraceae bacterium]